MIVHISVQEGNGDSGPGIRPHYRPWHNCKSQDEAVMVAAQQFLRERGGVLDAEMPFIFTVFSYRDTAPRREDGDPMALLATTMIARKETQS